MFPVAAMGKGKPQAAIERERDGNFTGMRWEEHNSSAVFKNKWVAPPSARLSDTLAKGFISPRGWSNASEGMWESKGRRPRHATGFAHTFQSPVRTASTADGVGAPGAWKPCYAENVSGGSPIGKLPRWNKSPDVTTPARTVSTPEIRKRALQGREREPAHLRQPGAFDPFGKLKVQPPPLPPPPPPDPPPFTPHKYSAAFVEPVASPVTAKVGPSARASPAPSWSPAPAPSWSPAPTAALSSAPACALGLREAQSTPSLPRRDAWRRASPERRANVLIEASREQNQHRAQLLRHGEAYTRWRSL